MSSSGSRREKHLLSLRIDRILDDRYGWLVRPLSERNMFVTNLRNRPLSGRSLGSLVDLILSLYHNLVTGYKNFPVVFCEGYFSSKQLNNYFTYVEQENSPPSPLTNGPPGVMVPPAGSRFQILTPVLPEKAAPFVLKADQRNCVRTVEIDGVTVTRVISTVYRTEDTEMRNRWRVTDYNTEGHILMSVLCQFSKKSAMCAKKKATEAESNNRSPTPPRKCLRV